MNGSPTGCRCGPHIADFIIADQRNLCRFHFQPLLNRPKEACIRLGIANVRRNKNRLASGQAGLSADDAFQAPVEIRGDSELKTAEPKLIEGRRYILVEPPLLRLSEMQPELLEDFINVFRYIADDFTNDRSPAPSLVGLICLAAAGEASFELD